MASTFGTADAVAELARRGLPLIRGGGPESEGDPPANPTQPAHPPAGDDRAAGLERDLAQARQLAEERAAALQQRDAELEALRQSAAEHAQRAAETEQRLLEAHRAWLLAEHRGQVVDELVTGNTVEELTASVEAARAAHARIAERVRQQATASVSAGNAPRSPEPDLSKMSPQEKVAYGLRQRSGQQ